MMKGVKKGDFLTIESPNGTIETQVFVYEGIRPDVLAIPIGLGHKAYGRYAKNKGVNPIKLLSPVTDSISGGLAWLSTKVSAKKTGKHRQFVQTQYTESQYQELPDAITTGVWDSWVEVHPDTAKKLGVKNGDFLTIIRPWKSTEVSLSNNKN